MKNQSVLLILFVTTLVSLSACQKSDSLEPAPDPNSTGPATSAKFNPADYVEYVTCKVGNTVFTSGNKALTNASITVTFAGNWLYIDADNREFVPGNVAAAEVSLQLGNFSKTTIKNYDIRGSAPLEVLKLNGTSSTSGDSFDSNDAAGTNVQAQAIQITQIKDGFLYGTFACKVYNQKDRTKLVDVTEGSFKVHIP